MMGSRVTPRRADLTPASNKPSACLLEELTAVPAFFTLNVAMCPVFFCCFYRWSSFLIVARIICGRYASFAKAWLS
jgi:hypothetical protein